jgi:hypothetical protein
MRNAAAQCGGRVQDRPAGYWKLAQNAKKILFRGNEPKNVLEIKELSVLRLKNEPKIEHQKRKSNPRMWPEIDKCRRIFVPARRFLNPRPSGRWLAPPGVWSLPGHRILKALRSPPPGNGKKADG